METGEELACRYRNQVFDYINTNIEIIKQTRVIHKPQVVYDDVRNVFTIHIASESDEIESFIESYYCKQCGDTCAKMEAEMISHCISDLTNLERRCKVDFSEHKLSIL